MKTTNLKLIQTAARAGLDHPELVELYVSKYPGSVRVIGYMVLCCASEEVEMDWILVCNRVRENERDNKWKQVVKILKDL